MMHSKGVQIDPQMAPTFVQVVELLSQYKCRCNPQQFRRQLQIRGIGPKAQGIKEDDKIIFKHMEISATTGIMRFTYGREPSS
jgi:hypothetical protein